MRSIALFAVFICVACAPEERQELELEAGPGSAEPHLAVGADGTVLLSYLEPTQNGTALRFSQLNKNRWSEPKTVATGEDWMVNWAAHVFLLSGMTEGKSAQLTIQFSPLATVLGFDHRFLLSCE